MLTPEGEDGEFEFYLKFAKPLVLNLPNTSDRIKAATWIRYLKKESTDPALRGEYLKLLLFVLQRRKLFGPFATIPDESKPLEKFPAEINIQDVAKNFVEVDKKVLKATLQRGGFGEWPPYTTACSSDLTEYAATQEIPNFGVQAYFAISRDPLQQWDQFDKAIFPIGENIETIQPECTIVTASPDISCFVSPDQTEPTLPSSPPRPTPRISPYGPKDETPPKELEDVSPESAKPLSPTRDMDDFHMDDRVPPTWGSNLVNVKDSPSPISPVSPVKDLDIEVSDQDMLDFFNDDIDLFEADIDEASSYLQGDTLTSPSRSPPVSPARSPSPERHAAPSGEPPYPEDYIDMAKDVDEDMKVIESKLPATTPQRSLSPQRPSSPVQVAAGQTCPGRTCPGGEVQPQRTSPQKSILSPDKLFDALEYIATDKDMLDFFNDSSILLEDDQLISPEQLPPTAPGGSPRVSPTTSKPPSPRVSEAPCPGTSSTTDSKKSERQVSRIDKVPSLRTSKAKTSESSVSRTSKVPSVRASKAPCPGTSSATGSKTSQTSVSRIGKVPSVRTSKAPCPGSSSATGSKTSGSSVSRVGKVPSVRTSKAPCPGSSSATGSKTSQSSVSRIGKVPSIRTCKAPCPATSETTGSKKSEKPVSRISKIPSVRTSKAPCPGTSSTTGPKKSERPGSRISKLPGLRTSKAPKKSERPVSGPSAEDEELRQLEEEIFGVSSEAAEQDSPVKDIASTVQEILEEMNLPSTSVLKTTGEAIEQAIMNKTGEDLGGDSFTAPDNQEYRWLNDMSGGPGLPEDEQQDPALWEPYEWWSDDPDEIFQNYPPSPRVYEEEPYTDQRESWERSPPIFSRDPRIREGPAAQRQYTVQEFGMESFEEPVWTSADQYFKYKKDFSPFIDPRSIDRKTLDPSQFPNFEMQRQFADIRGAPEEERFFGTETSPDYLDISFNEQDFQPMSRIEAALEAAKHGPQYIGVKVPTSTPEKTAEEWAMSMLERPFLLTPPEPNLDADELEDSLSKYIEEDLKIIDAKVPVTTPQRSPSPKRLPNILKEAPPFVPDIDVEPDPYVVSPELIFPDRHVVPPQRDIDWDENIGTPQKFQKTDSVVIESEEELRDRHLKRKQQLKLLLERQFESPPKVPTPPAMPHLMDEPIPSRRLPAALPATKLPPSNWAWKTPPSLKSKPYIPSRKLTPTGISPPRPVSEDITMFYESPPEGFLSPSGAVESLQQTPPEGFGREPSPIKSPGGRQLPECGPCDEIDMEMMYPTQFEEYDFPELYQSPEKPESPSPERKAWRDKVGAHEKTGFRRKTFVIRPKPGRSYRVTRSREPSLSPLVETSPPEPQRPNIVDAELEEEISALEAEIFRESPSREPRPPDPDELSPDYERRMWQESLKLHDPVPYDRNRVIVVPKPTKYSRKIILKRRSEAPSLRTIYSPSHPQFGPSQREEQLREMKLQAEREVAADKEQIKFKKPDRRRYCEMISHRCNEFSITSSFGRAMLRPKLNLPKSPEPYVSPERPPHILDEPIPEGLPESLSARKLPPSNWSWKTPPKYQTKPYVPKERKTPTGISPVRKVSQEISMFFESPPEEFLSPTDAVSSLQFTPPEGFGSEPSPDRVPTAPQFDEIDREMMYPSELEDEVPEFYQSPEQLSPERQDWRDRVEGHEKTGFRRKTFVVRPKPGRSYRVTRSRKPKLGTLAETSPPEPNIADAELEAEISALEAEIFRESPSREPRPPDPDELSPDYERRMWQESLKLHDPVPYDRNRVIVVPKPTKYSRKIILKRRSEAPSLRTIYSPTHPQYGPSEREERLRQMKLQAEREVAADKEQIKFKKPDRRRYCEMISHRCNEFSITSSFGRAMLRPKLNLPKSPEPYVSPERPPHILDEPMPEGLPESLSARKLPPSNWSWKTPPKYQTKPYVPKERKTPTGISPVQDVSEDITMFYESPPEGLLSPTDAVSSLQYTPPEGFGSEPSPDRVPSAPQFDEIDREMMYPSELEDEDPEFYQSPEQLSPERQDWRDRVEGHEKTGFRRKSFVVRPKPGRSYKVTRSRKPRLGTLAETSPPEPQRPNIVDAELEAEISALEAEIFRESPSREPRPPDPDELSPDYERRMWQESLKLHDPVPYDRNRVIVVPKPTKYSRKIILKRRSESPSLRTIYSPTHPQYGPSQREEHLRQMKLQAEREVAADKEQIKFKKPDRRRYCEMISHRCNEFSITSSFGRAMMRPKLNLPPSPPQPTVSPERPPHIFDEPVPAGQPPALLPPSNWTWRTPPKYQTKPYVPKEKKTPTGISPIRPVSQEISMFFESPPEEFLSPTDAVSSLQFTPPEGFGSEPSPDRVPSAPQFDEIDREMMYPSELYDEDPEFYQSPEQLSPERQDWRDRVEGHEKTGFRRKSFVVRPKPGRSYKVTRSRKPRLGTLAETSPPEPQRPNIVDAELEEEISALEAEIFRESPSREPRPPDPDDLSPDYERRMWQESLKLHDPVPYDKNKRVIVVPKPTKYSRKIILKRRSQTPSLRTIYSPTHPQYGPSQREEHLRATKLQAEREVAADKEQIKFKKPDRRRYCEMISHRCNEFSITSSFGRAMLRPKLNLPKSPEPYVSPERPPHILDEPMPEGLPESLSARKLPPSNWSWKTPPKYQTKPYVPEERKTPTGISPVRVVSKEITMFYESPPEGLLSPTDAVSSLQYTPPEDFGSEPSPDRVPSAPQFDEIDREMMYPSELYDEDPEFYQSPEQLSPERQDWRDRVEGHEKTGFRRKSFVVRPKPGRSYKVTRSRKPRLGTLAETSPPEPQRPNIVDAELEAEISALEAEIFRESPSREPRPPDPDELSPDYERRMWQESLKLHDPVPYDRNRIIVVPKPTKYSRKIILKRRSEAPSLRTIYSPTHPQYAPSQREEHLRATKLQAEREVAADKEQIKFKKPDRRRYCEMISHRCNEFSITSSFGRAMMRPKLNLPKSPEPYVSPERPPHILDEPMPEGLPESLPATKLPPGNWAWRTPPKYQMQPYVPTKKVTPTGISPVRRHPPGSLFNESPPQMYPLPDFSPSCDYSTVCGSPPPMASTFEPTEDDLNVGQYLPEGFDDQVAPELYSSPEYEEPIEEFPQEGIATLEEEIFVDDSTPARERLPPMRTPLPSPSSPMTPEHEREAWMRQLKLHDRTPYRKKTFTVKPSPGKTYRVTKSQRPGLTTVEEKYYEWSPEQRQIDGIEMPESVDDYDLLNEQSPEYYSDSPSAPAPPPRPPTPAPFLQQPRRIPRRRAPLDPNILYASTPSSAVKDYQPEVERIRFEARRPMSMRPVTPPPVSQPYYQTPIPPGTRPWKKRRRPIERTARRRLEFDEDEREFERDMIQELQSHLETARPGGTGSRDVQVESPPYDLDTVSLLGDFSYEPDEFNMYVDDDVPQYDVRPAFYGQPDDEAMDTSMTEDTDNIPYDQRNFRWMDYATRCPWKRS